MMGTHLRTGEVRLVRHYRIFDHAREDGLDGLLTVIGVKYTTARYVAQETLKYIASKMGKTLPRCQTETTRLYGGEIERFAELLQENVERKPQGLAEQVMRHLTLHYGSALGDILHYGSAGRTWLENISGSAEVLHAEVLHAVRAEMALKLADVVLRRTDLGSAGNPGKQALADAARIMAQELGWSDARCRAEIAAVEQLYVPASA
jgi:glycerol-3-phosphate dehydrogenase